MSKTAATLALLATAAVFTGFYTPTENESFLSASNQSIDPCEQLNYRTVSSFNSFYSSFRNATLTTQISLLKTNLTQAEGVLRNNQTAQILKATSCADAESRIQIFNVIANQIVYLTTDNVVDIMITTGGEQKSQIQFLQLLVPYIKDPTDANNKRIVEIFYGTTVQSQVQTVLKAATGVDCIWGGIQEKIVTFVVDDSGSMGEHFYFEGKRITRMDYVKNSLSDTLSNQLRDFQKFNIVRFHSSASKWKSEHVPATKSNIDEAIKYVKSLRAGGGTNISDALSKAFDTRETLEGIYFLSDGYPSYGIQSVSGITNHVEKLEKSMKKHVSVNTISFMLGKVSSSELRKGKEVLQAIAKASQGSFKQMSN